MSGREAYTLPARAFRYVHIASKHPMPLEVYADFEYLPLADIGHFRCEEEQINKIWEVSAYTLHLNSREFFLDGIKRDHWVWGGDAYQSFLMDYCLFFDAELIKRTMTALVGKPPYLQHINTITDYTLYMIIALWDYYFYTGDIEFVRFIYPRIKGLYDFTASRLDENGFLCQRAGDWIFIDWSPMDKSGPLCAEQLLLWKAELSMAKLSEALAMDASAYQKAADALREKIDLYFWNEEKGAYIDTFASGKNNVTRHANIFAVLYDFADADRQKSILEHVLKNDRITQITTPYFNLFQLMARCKLGDMEYVQHEISRYWGGMICLGATTMWEEYDPRKIGIEHYEMYGGKFEKSLCHAWGAGPILLLSRYCLGVKPLEVGCKRFEVHPNFGLYRNVSGTVPLCHGKVEIHFRDGILTVTADCPGGYVVSHGERIELLPNETVMLENYQASDC